MPPSSRVPGIRPGRAADCLEYAVGLFPRFKKKSLVAANCNGNCKLCLEIAILRYSHIIPELCYLAAYNDNHRAKKLTSDSKRHPPLQKGIREYLLCDKCEGRLSKIENAFKKYWYGGPALSERIQGGVHNISGFDYTPFKLFHLSILWRASVSTLPEFRTVNLGPYEEKLRQMLLDLDAGPVDHFPIFGIVLLDEYRPVYNLVTQPQVSKPDGIHAYYLCYSGCEWNFILTDHIHGELANILPAVPQLEGSMRLGARDWTQSNSVRAFVYDRSRQAAKQ